MTPVLGHPKDRQATPCSSCGAAMTFITTAAGALMPLSMGQPAKPAERPGPQLLWVELEPGVWAQRWAYHSHFVHCPQADQHRKART
jgi:hypothetical protein